MFFVQDTVSLEIFGVRGLNGSLNSSCGLDSLADIVYVQERFRPCFRHICTEGLTEAGSCGCSASVIARSRVDPCSASFSCPSVGLLS